MATDVPPDDDDAWLYGDNNNAEEQRKEEINAIFERATEDISVPGEESVITTNGEVDGSHIPDEAIENNIDLHADTEKSGSKDNEEEKDSDDDEDSDDDVQVTIGDIKATTPATTYYGAPAVNLNIKRGSAFPGAPGGVGGKTKGVDLDTIGVINGVSLYDFNLDTIEDKPWRKPGADITDYFNYGFNEDTWKVYCDRQRQRRIDYHKPSVVQLIAGKDQQIPIATVNENSKYSGVGTGIKKAGPPPGRRTSGSIDVICGATRRGGNAKENVIQVIGRDGFDPSMGGMPPTHIPPPFIPPNLSVPPPGMPPGMPPTIPPPGMIPGVPFPDLYGNPVFSQPPPVMTGVDSNSQYDEQYFTGSARPYDGNSESQHSWANSPHRDRDRERDGRNRDRSREKERDHYWEERGRDRSSNRMSNPEDEYKRREREEYERRRYREYRERRDKERYERDYDREYHDRERDSRERDRERRHRERDKEREERHKDRSSRRRHHHDDEEDHHSTSSRHKHKKSKREKDETSNLTSEDAENSQQEVILIEEEEK